MHVMWAQAACEPGFWTLVRFLLSHSYLRGNAVYAVQSRSKCLCVSFPGLPPTEPTKSESK